MFIYYCSNEAAGLPVARQPSIDSALNSWSGYKLDCLDSG